MYSVTNLAWNRSLAAGSLQKLSMELTLTLQGEKPCCIPSQPLRWRQALLYSAETRYQTDVNGETNFVVFRQNPVMEYKSCCIRQKLSIKLTSTGRKTLLYSVKILGWNTSPAVFVRNSTPKWCQSAQRQTLLYSVTNVTLKTNFAVFLKTSA